VAALLPASQEGLSSMRLLKFTKVQIPPYATSVLVFSLFIILITLHVSAYL
jgi:hypothetical protein